MQRLSAARRLRAGAVDRQVALASFGLVAIGLVCAVVFSHAPLPAVRATGPRVSVRDPGAARDLVGLMRAGERGAWIVQYGFSRTTVDGRVLRRRGEEGRSGEWHVVVTGAAMTLEHGDSSSECDRVGDQYGCRATPGGRALAESSVVRVVVDAGAYDVVRGPDATIAGIRARCFRMRATGHGSLPDFGVETERCLSRDGIPLRRWVARPPGNVEEHITTSVLGDATPLQVRALALARESALAQR